MKQRGTPAFFLVFWAHSKAVPLNTKSGAEGHPRLFSRFLGPGLFFFFFVIFAQLQKRCHAASKMKQRDTGPFFLSFCGAFKSGVTLHQK